MPKKAEISITHIDLYDKLISCYFGGSVDVYKPINPLNTMPGQSTAMMSIRYIRL